MDIRCSRWILASLIYVAAALVMNPSASAQEICGLPNALDPLFKNGFEGISVPEAAKLAPIKAVRTAAATAQSKSLHAPLASVTISYPAATATIDSARTDVSGTFVGPGNTGIVVNGVRAHTMGSIFLATDVALTSGANTLTAVATAFDGSQVQSSDVIVTSSVASGAVDVFTINAFGYAPLRVQFTPSANLPAGLQQLSVDFDGDGLDDATSTSPTTPISHTFPIAGLYVIRVRFTENGGPTTTVFRRILIQDIAEARQTLCDVFGALRSGLAAGDANAALVAILPGQRTRYQRLFTSLGANMPVAATRLGTIANGLIDVDSAQLKLIKTVSGEPSVFSVQMLRDENGVWRIEGL